MSMLLHRLLDANLAESILGDLEEERQRRARRSRLAARLWYWRASLAIVAFATFRRVYDAVAEVLTSRFGLSAPGGDVAQAARSLRRSPWYSATVVGVIAMSMALATTTFAIVDGVLFKPLPYPASSELFVGSGGYAKHPSETPSLSPEEIQRWRVAAPDVRIGVMGLQSTLGRTADLEEVRTVSVSPELLDVLGVRPLVAAASGTLVLLACLTLAGLGIARVEDRAREVAPRRAIGAGGWAIARLQSVEALVLAAIGTSIGVALAAPVLTATLRLLPDDLPLLNDPTIDLRVLLFAAAAVFVTSLLIALWPATVAARTGLSPLRARSGQSQSTKPTRGWARRALVAGEVALALVLTLGGTLVVGSLALLWSEDHGYSEADSLIIEFSVTTADRLGSRTEIAAIETVLVARVMTMREALADSIRARHLNAWTFGVFATASIAIAVVGILGLIAMATSRRTREIGIRSALGGKPIGVVGLIVREQVVPVAAGLLVGGTVAAWAGQFIGAYLYRFQPSNPRLWTMAVGAVITAALAGTLIPAWRASRVDPVQALRAE